MNKYLIPTLILTSMLLTACGGSAPQGEPEDFAAIEICLDQGGEWQGECVFENEYCAVRARCKPNAEFCPCTEWGIKE